MGTWAVIVEVIGYVALAIVGFSFLSSNLKKIRIANIIGCVVFITYAILKGGMFPVLMANVMIMCIQVYKMFVEKRDRRSK